MLYKVEGTMFFEGVVDIKNPEKALEDFNKTIFKTDIEGLAEHIITCYVAREMDFVEGVGSQGEDFLVDDESTWFDDYEITEIK